MRGVLIVNTGSPHSTSKEDVKWFIGEMLSDPLVLTVPDNIRNFLAKKIIAPLRASRSAAKYSLIWDNEHNMSPLIRHSRALAEKIENEAQFPTEIAMRYGAPEISDALDRLSEKEPNLHEVVVIPMFPQYAQSSYQTTVDAIGKCFYKKAYPFRLKIIEPFFDDYEYIHALSQSLKPYVEKEYDRLIFSFHSLPLEHEQKACAKGKQFDYVYQIKETVRLVSKELQIDPNKNRVVYASAMGSKWLKPDLNETLKQLAKEGTKRIIALTPGFPADNLETLYDLDICARKTFLKYGGQEFDFVPALNSSDFWVDGLIRMITRTI
ncbi:ferrochelatase [Dysgonomonas sp. 216]|uniref:ferrochelatase n=1 Tax=Dysgonomonas sp. 216 TaxID=2302934 RepID=UPI0013D43E9B|nr:ferrochelatase [Dysgonomonas sp. 216]NDW19057.1 ferrochelatase [Dysgonomonas sp. 216]